MNYGNLDIEQAGMQAGGVGGAALGAAGGAKLRKTKKVKAFPGAEYVGATKAKKVMSPRRILGGLIVGGLAGSLLGKDLVHRLIKGQQ